MSAFVYAIRCEAGGPIKIGFTSYPKDRFRSLGATEILGLRECEDSIRARNAEHAMHRKLREFALGHEWFRPEQAVLDLVATMGAGDPEPDRSTVTITTRLPIGLSRRLKVEAARRHTSVQELVNNGVEMALGDL